MPDVGADDDSIAGTGRVGPSNCTSGIFQDVLFPCARCGTKRASLDAACTKCGWAPKPSHEAAAKPGQQSPLGRLEDSDLRARAMLLAVVGVGAALFGIYKWISRGSMGDPCNEDDDCSSRICLPGADKAEYDRQRKEAEERMSRYLTKVGQAQDDDEADALVPPDITIVVRRNLYPGTCTQLCDDDECPVGWHCGKIRETSWTKYSFRTESTKKLCFAPDDPQLSGTGE